MNKQENEIKRWTAKCKTKVVLDILKGKLTGYKIQPTDHRLVPAADQGGSPDITGAEPGSGGPAPEGVRHFPL